MKLRKVPRAVLVAMAVVAAAVAGALAETVYVKVRNTRMVDKPDTYKGKLVKRLYHREKLERLKKGKKWDKVKSGDKTGYVRSRDLARKRPADVRKQGSGWKWLPGSKDPTFTAGTRALGPLGKEYTKKNNLEKGRKVVEERMDKMKLDLDKLEKFQREGRVGDFAGEEEQK